MQRLLLISFLLWSIFSHAQEVSLESIVNSKSSEEDPAVLAGVVQNGEIIFRTIRGMANLEHQIKADENTRSNIASTAKQFTALMVLDLSQKGKLNLEEDIRKYFPNLYPDIKEEIKIRHLLNHTSGIRDYCDLLGLKGKAWWRRVGLDNDDVLKLISKQNTIAFPPGSSYEYSNTGYILLAEIVAKVTDQDFVEYSTKFFQKLGMNQTAFPEDYMKVIPNQASPYSDWGDGVFQKYPSVTSTYGEGFLYTTLDDQLHYEQLLQNAQLDGNELLIQSQQSIPNNDIETYGFGLEFSKRAGYWAIHHEGATGSYSCQTIRFPEQRLSVFVMTNNSRVWSYGLAEELAIACLPANEEEDNEQSIRYSPKLDMVPKKKLSHEVLGEYNSESGTLIRVLKEEGNVVWKIKNRGSIPLVKESENLYHAGYDASLKIGFFENEAVVLDNAGGATIYPRIENNEPNLADYQSFVGEYFNDELETRMVFSLQGNDLMVMMDDWKDPNVVDVANRDILYEGGTVANVERDQFNRVVAMRVDHGRAKNIRFAKKTNRQFQPTIPTADGSISVTTIGSIDGSASDILLTKNYENGNEIWSKQFGGSNYDKANSIVETKDGYLIVGSTSSFGKGNYDMLVIKTDKNGKKQWQNTFGNFLNEYGYIAEITEDGYLIKGSIQQCEGENVHDGPCSMNVWVVNIDKKGQEISSEVLEEMTND